MTASSGQFIAHEVALSRYQVWVPRAYDPACAWPAILFLHGAGERGNDGVAQTTVGLGRALSDGKVDPPALVIFPQCPLTTTWIGGALSIADAALGRAMNDYAIDPSRVSLTGISMGGAGAWMLAFEQPRRFSALAPVCGWPPVPPRKLAQRVGGMPIRIFHGSHDRVVPVGESRKMAAALGARASYTEFAGVNHNSWDPAYMTTDLVAWLVAQVNSAASSAPRGD
jgi:predicted peptidase